MKKYYSISIIIFFISTVAVNAGETLQLNSFFPAPIGGYNQILLVPKSTEASCIPGTLETSLDGFLQYCKEGENQDMEWTSMGAWTSLDDVLYPNDYANPSLNISFGGTATPGFKLNSTVDGGIFSTGTFGSGLDLPLAVAGEDSQMIWHPKSSSFIAGESTGWRDSFIYDYTFAFGKNSLARANYSTVVGYSSLTSATYSTILGGDSSIASTSYSFLGGGDSSLISSKATHATIFGGKDNTHSVTSTPDSRSSGETYSYSTFGSGNNNLSRATYATNLGGDEMEINQPYGTILGGNHADSEWPYAFIGGGKDNENHASYGSILNGENHRLGSDDDDFKDATGDIGYYGTIVGGLDVKVKGNYGFGAGKKIYAEGDSDHSFVWGHASSKYTLTDIEDEFIIFPNIYTSKIGIGTKSPVRQLHLTNSTDAILKIEATDTPDKSKIIFRNYASSTNEVDVGYEGNTSTLRINHKNSGSNKDIEFATHGDARMTIKNDGTVGVGYIPSTKPSRLKVNLAEKVVDATYPSHQWLQGFSVLGTAGDSYFPAQDGEIYLTGHSDGSATGDILFRTFNSGSYSSRMIVKGSTGQVGFGIEPTHALDLAGGAYSDGNTWTVLSSRDKKKEIVNLKSDDAYAALNALVPVTFRYIQNPDDLKVGFIAEDVPDLVATKDKKGLSELDILAVLTKVAQEQQNQIHQLQQALDSMK